MSLTSIQLTAYNVPEFTEQNNKEWVTYGKDNLFPVYLVDLFNSSPLHNSIITGKVNYITGRGLVQSNELEFVFKPNPYESMQQIFNKVALDYEIYNGYAIEVIRNRMGEIVEMYHADFSKYRVGKDDETLYYSEDWEAKYSSNKNRSRNYNPKVISCPRFNKDKNQKKSIIYHTEYRPGLKYYPLPDYVGALAVIETSVEIGNFDLNAIKNGFAGGTIINLLNGIPSEEEQEVIEAKILEKMSGSENGNRIILMFSDDVDHSAKIESLNGNDLADRFDQLEKRVNQSIYQGHKVPGILFGQVTPGALGQRNEMIDSYQILNETYVLRRQTTLIEQFNDILEYKGLERVLTVQELRPLSKELDISTDTIERLAGDDALRSYIEATYGIETVEGTNVNDQVEMARENVIYRHLFNTAQDISGVELFSGEIHNESDVWEVDFADDKATFKAKVAGYIKRNKNIALSEIAEAMEVTVKEVEIVVEELVRDKMVKRIGAALSVLPAIYPLLIKDPSQDLVVAYKYELRGDVPTEKTVIKDGKEVKEKIKSRAFCARLEALSSMGKVWLKKDIEMMSNDMEVTFIPDINDVWAYRGGWYRKQGEDVAVPFCRHTWRQVVLTGSELRKWR